MPSLFDVPAAANSWSTSEIQTLRTLVDSRLPLSEIARTLRRTPSAIRNRAGLHGISLRGLAREPKRAA